MKKLLLYLLFLLTFFCTSQSVHADSYEATYNFDFYPKQNGDVYVDLAISLSSLRSDVYIDEYILSIPNNFFSEKLIANIDTDGVDYKIESSKQGKRIIFSFEEPEASSLSTQHTINLSYKHENLLLLDKNTSELILPLIKGSPGTSSNATLHLPEFIDYDPSIIKPRPTNIDQDIVKWESINANSLYLLFGTSALYNIKINYPLVNSGFGVSDRVVTFPPDTLYQKSIVKRIQPHPNKTWTDSDGNFLASFLVQPRDSLTVEYEGTVEVFPKARNELLKHTYNEFTNQKNHLLSDIDYWNLGSYYDDSDIANLETVSDIYSFILNTFTYDESRLSSNPSRRGAEMAISKPFNALCSDFTDTFIAIAREKGIHTREIQGYGYSKRTDIRPQSLVKSTLHSWPEYYDTDRNIWVQVDPTWEQTSGIDYFNSFDMSHIAFAIHGKKSDDPLPPTKIDLETTNTIVSETQSMQVIHNIPRSLAIDNEHKATVTVKNSGNTFLYGLAINLTSHETTINKQELYIDSLAPYESKDISIYLKPRGDIGSTDQIDFLHNGEIIKSHVIEVVEFSNDSNIYIAGAGLGIVVLLVVLVILRFIKV